MGMEIMSIIKANLVHDKYLSIQPVAMITDCILNTVFFVYVMMGSNV